MRKTFFSFLAASFLFAFGFLTPAYGENVQDIIKRVEAGITNYCKEKNPSFYSAQSACIRQQNAAFKTSSLAGGIADAMAEDGNTKPAKIYSACFNKWMINANKYYVDWVKLDQCYNDGMAKK